MSLMFVDGCVVLMLDLNFVAVVFVVMGKNSVIGRW